jgi:hypothetical protein
MSRFTGLSVTVRIAVMSASPSAGVPSASITTTPSGVTTKPALALKPSFAADATPALPCT